MVVHLVELLESTMADHLGLRMVDYLDNLMVVGKVDHLVALMV